MDQLDNYVWPAYAIKNGRKQIIVGGTKMHPLFSLINKLSLRPLNVLLLGETGTGKELVARAIHYNNNSSHLLPFLAVNCAALNEGLFESTLFGHKKGSFTGAHKDQTGIVEAAEGGTLFLDEIGDMSLSLQARVLRLLQEKEITPVGSATPLSIDFRVIAATNKDLSAEIQAGHFRSDLYYRLSEYPVNIPPLRQRKEDITLLVDHFVEKYNSLYQASIVGLDQSAHIALVGYDWPGNIRELESVIKRAFVHKTEGTFSRHELLFDTDITSISLPIASNSAPDKRLEILREGAEHGSSQSAIAKLLLCTPNHVKNLLRKYRLYDLWKEKSLARVQTITLHQVQTPHQSLVNILLTHLYQKAAMEENKPIMAAIRYQTHSFIGKKRLLVDFETAVSIFQQYYENVETKRKVSILALSRQYKIPRSSLIEILDRAKISVHSNLRRAPLHIHGRVLAALSLDIPMEDTAYFLGISAATLTYLFKRAGKTTPPTRPLEGKRWYQSTYRKASQTFEALDLGFSKEEIAELIEIPYAHVTKYQTEESIIRPKIVSVLQTLYPEEKLDRPYLEGNLRSVVYPVK